MQRHGRNESVVARPSCAVDFGGWTCTHAVALSHVRQAILCETHMLFRDMRKVPGQRLYRIVKKAASQGSCYKFLYLIKPRPSAGEEGRQVEEEEHSGGSRGWCRSLAGSPGAGRSVSANRARGVPIEASSRLVPRWSVSRGRVPAGGPAGLWLWPCGCSCLRHPARRPTADSRRYESHPAGPPRGPARARGLGRRSCLRPAPPRPRLRATTDATG